MKKIAFLFLLLLLVSCNSKAEKSKVPEKKVGLTASEKEANLNTVPEGLRNSPLFSLKVVEPTQLFDNIYFVGYVGVGVFVIPTPDGIVLIDAMWTPEDVSNVIVPGIQQLGFDPKDIKYVLLTHEHVDHYGGARYLEDTYGAKTLMTKIAWEELHDPNARVLVDPFGNKSSEMPIPSTYQEIKDKEIMTFGETTIEVLETPGHSKGGISLLISTTDQGKPVNVGVWGGSGLPQTLAANKSYLNSLNYYEDRAIEEQVVAQITDHPFSNNLLDNMKILRKRKLGDKNPIIKGTKAFQQHIDSTLRKTVVDKIASLTAS